MYSNTNNSIYYKSFVGNFLLNKLKLIRLPTNTAIVSTEFNGCRIHRLLLCRRARPPPPAFKECPGYITKQSDGEAPVMLELWGKRSTPLLPSLPDPLRPGVVAPDKFLSMGQ